MSEIEPVHIIENCTMDDDPKPSPGERVAACQAAIDKALSYHRCVILPSLRFEPVGQTMSKALASAVYSVEPLE